MAKKKKPRKKKKCLTYEQKLEFATAVKNGKMVKQVVADYGISYMHGYAIIKEFLEWKLEWKIKEPDNA